MTTNRAVRLSRFGGADALTIEPIETPEPKAGEVLVRVAAASVNPIDYKTRAGEFPFVTEADLPVVLGRDLAGAVEALGPDAGAQVNEGDAVFAFIGPDRGGQAEYVIVKADELVAAPKSLNPVHAAAVPLAAMTAWQGLFDHGGLAQGQRVLIHGGAGGVGHFAIQLAKAKGATVFTTASAGDLDFVRALGAETAIDYKAQRFEDVAHDIDVVFDLIGGETYDRSWAVVREGGIVVSTLMEPDEAKAAEHRARAAPSYGAEPNVDQLRQVADLIDLGKVKVVVSETFRFDDVRDAYTRLEKGSLRGKLVLTVG